MGVSFNAGRDIVNTVHGNQTFTEYTVTITNKLKEELQPEFDAAGIPEPVQEEILDKSTELVEAIKEQEPSKFQQVIKIIREKGPEVADAVLAKCIDLGIKAIIGLV